MEREEPREDKKIWVDPELTFMPMKKVKSGVSNNAPHERIANNNVYANDDVVVNSGNVS